MHHTMRATALKCGLGLLTLLIASVALSCPCQAAEFEPILRSL